PEGRVTPVKRAVSVVVFEPGARARVLAVRRPPDDEDFPDAWGLPAASLREGETWEDAVRRAGHDKLGVELAVGPMRAEGSRARGGSTLAMRLYEATIAGGLPRVPQRAADVTQYTAWEWSDPSRLQPAARRGSLCSRLCLGWLTGAR
ncbi:MAG: NUDIX hydrolase, partial [Gemmatimonadota bacterium]